MKKLDAFQRAAAKRAARCPDCDSHVTVTDTAVSVAHDDGCPTLAALERQGRTSSLAIVRGAGQSNAGLAADIAAVVQVLGPAVLRTDPYSDLSYGGDR